MWSEVHVPTVAADAARQVSRERTALTQDQTRLVNQMRGWLATWGVTLPGHRRSAWAKGIPDRTPHALASREAVATTWRGRLGFPSPPTTTGRPRRSGRRRTSTAARNVSMSTCNSHHGEPPAGAVTVSRLPDQVRTAL